VIQGSHKLGIVEHYDATDTNPVGGALQADVDKSTAVLVEYNPGEQPVCSVFHAATPHPAAHGGG
jgi:hypothetical protein